MQKPTIGRIVHYCAEGSIVYPAIITEVVQFSAADAICDVDLYVIGNSRCTPFPAGSAPYSDQYKSGCWSWPSPLSVPDAGAAQERQTAKK